MIKKIKDIFIKYWISFQQGWDKADEIHQKIEAQKIENQLRYQNGSQRKY